MSMVGNIAVEGAMEELQKLLEKTKGKPVQEQLDALRRRIESIRETASKGWY